MLVSFSVDQCADLIIDIRSIVIGSIITCRTNTTPNMCTDQFVRLGKINDVLMEAR